MLVLLGNLLWFIFGLGVVSWAGWMLLGILQCLTLIGIPFGIAAFRIAGFAAFPFGKDLVDNRVLGERRIPGTSLANLVWILLAGLWLTIGHAVAGVGYCVTVVGIPFGLAHFKLAQVSFAPLGKTVVRT